MRVSEEELEPGLVVYVAPMDLDSPDPVEHKRVIVRIGSVYKMIPIIWDDGRYPNTVSINTTDRPMYTTWETALIGREIELVDQRNIIWEKNGTNPSGYKRRKGEKMDSITKDELSTRLEAAKMLESKIDDLQRQEREIEKLLKSGHVFEISLKREAYKSIIFCASSSGLDPFMPMDFKNILEILLCAVSKRLHTLKVQYSQL